MLEEMAVFKFLWSILFNPSKLYINQCISLSSVKRTHLHTVEKQLKLSKTVQKLSKRAKTTIIPDC